MIVFFSNNYPLERMEHYPHFLNVLRMFIQTFWKGSPDAFINSGHQLKDADGNTFLHFCASRGYHNVFRYIDTQSVWKNVFLQPNNKGELPLHLAATELDVLQIIAKYYPDINVQTYNGDTVLHYTVNFCPQRSFFFKSPTLFLIQNGAKAVANKQNLNPLGLARFNGNSDAVN